MNYDPRILPKVYKPFFKEEFTREELELHIVKEAEGNANVISFLSDYHSGCHERFILDYAKAKADVILELSDLRDQVEGVDIAFTKFASDRIWDIQQKKLFDLQCQWRAEKITIPGIESTWDFKYWERDIELCKFIPPITPEELELYRDFLRHSTINFDEYFDPEWQAYNDYKPDEDGDVTEELPTWYEYHNNVTGAGIWLTLPDVRGEKEEFYNDIWRANEENKRAEDEPSKPFVYFADYRIRDKFFEKLETKQFIKNFDEYARLNETMESDEQIEDAVHFLLQWHEEIPIEAGSDWRQAVIDARQRFVNAKTANALNAVYEEYKMREDLNIPHKDTPDQKYYELMKSLSRNTLEGRRLNGDPEDFNF